MTHRERFLAVLNGRKPDDRLPVVEWATWWDLTIKRWQDEGLDPELRGAELFQKLDLDVLHQFWLRHMAPDCPQPASHGAPLMEDEEDYEKLRPFLYPETANDPLYEGMRALKPQHDRGEIVIWYTIEGAFWFPRTLFGIEGHLFSFYDYPELYHRILEDLAQWQLRQLEKIYQICTPEFMTIAEDMSYNNGPMLSEKLFDEFLAPYYRKVIPYIREHGTKVIVDSDGDVTQMVPWLKRVGVEGILPLECQAGVNIPHLRQLHPDFILIGGFDKMVMKYGESAMREEFERILPVMKSGRYIPSVDHQTPPDVSLENYRTYVRLLHEYAEKAVMG